MLVVGEHQRDEIIPLTIVMALHELLGPLLLAAIPYLSDESFRNSVEFRGIKVFSSIDSEDLVEYGFLKAIYPWFKPKGLFHAMYFAVRNEQARGGHEIYLLGAVVDQRFSLLSRSRAIEVDSAIEESCRQVDEYLTQNNLNLATRPDIEHLDLRITGYLQYVLQDLRERLIAIAEDWLKEFEL